MTTDDSSFLLSLSYFKPRLVCMSDIVFHHPVEVGALLRMHSRVSSIVSLGL